MSKNQFSWIEFHRDLDTALAVYLSKSKDNHTTDKIIEFLKFSNNRMLAELAIAPPEEAQE